jgi:SYF2 splicing factor
VGEEARSKGTQGTVCVFRLGIPRHPSVRRPYTTLTAKCFPDYDDASRRKYKKDIDALKPDLASYKVQRQAAEGVSVSAGSSTDFITMGEGSSEVARAGELLYRDANSFVYADHKPSEDAIDKVVQKLNVEYVVLFL